MSKSFTDRIEQKARNAIEVYLVARDKDVRWASSAKRYGEEVAREYGDRFLIELIQNAYDANPRGVTDGKVSVVLDLGEGPHGVLYVANTGDAFSDANFQGITDIAQSPKPPGEGIGNKGVGFKSVAQISERPEIYSAHPEFPDGRTFDGYCFRLPVADDIAEMVDGRDLEDVLRDVPRYGLPIPVVNVPEQVSTFRDGSFCTVVRLPLDDERAAERAESEIDRLAAATTPLLLFLDRIALLQLRIIDADGSTAREQELRRRTRAIGEQSAVRVDEVDLGEQGTFIVCSRPVAQAALNAAIEASAPEIDGRWASWTQDSAVAVAAKLDHSNAAWHSYTFLPMDDSPSPLHAHANAPYFTKLDRNSVRFSIAFNSFLLDEIATLCVEAAEWIRDNAPVYAPICIDLICWKKEHLPRMTKAFEQRGMSIGEARVVPVVTQGDSVHFATVAEARRWGPFDPLMTTVTAERLCADAGAAVIDPALGDRVHNFSRLRYALTSYDRGEPTDGELSQWLELLAKNLRRADPALSGQGWMDFYDDIATAFAERDAAELQGRLLVIDDSNRLRRCGSSSESGDARTMFFAPVRDQTEGEEDVDSAFDVTRPPELSQAISFTREDLDWYVKEEGSRRTPRRCRDFLEREHLVRRYRAQDVLNAVTRFLRGRRKQGASPAELKAALLFVYKFKDRVTDSALESVGLHVPTASGWHPAADASFSVHWPHTQGATLTKLVQLTGSISPSLAGVGEHFLQGPAEWLPDDADRMAWTDFLLRLGVRDGLHPIPLTESRFEAIGLACTPAEWARFANLGEDFAQDWSKQVENWDECGNYSRTPYISVTELWGLPGQFEFESFSADAQQRYASLVVRNLGTWEADRALVGVRRERYPRDLHVRWPSPLRIFLSSANWVPVTCGDEQQRRLPGEAWTFDDDTQDVVPTFAPLMPKPLRRIARQDDEITDRLRSWCGIRCWNDSRDAPDVAAAVMHIVSEKRTANPELVWLAKDYERTLHQSLMQGRDPWSSGAVPGVVVRRDGELEVIELAADCGRIYIDNGSDPGTATLLAELGAPILCASHVDAEQATHMLGAVVGDQNTQLVSEVRVSVEVDGAFLADDTPSVPLIGATREWLVHLVVATLEFRSGRMRGWSDNGLRHAATRLRVAQVIPARDLRLSIDGHAALEGERQRDVFAVPTAERPVIVVTDFDGDIGWGTLEIAAHSIAAIVGSSEIGSALFEAIVRLQRSQHPDRPNPPTSGECAAALGVTQRQMDEVIGLLQSTMELLRERLPIAVACCVSSLAGRELTELLAHAGTEDDVLAALGQFDVDDPVRLLDSVKQVADLTELRDEYSVTYRDFNNILTELGRDSLADPLAHDQAFDYFLKRHRDALLASLQQPFYHQFRDGSALDGYVALRAFAGLHRNQSWPEDYDIPPDSVMTAQVNSWLREHGVPPLPNADSAVPSISLRRTGNRRAITAAGDEIGALVRAWCVKNGRTCPAVWAGDGCGGRIADWADEEGLLDFSDLDGLRPLLAHLGRCALWPTGMPHALDSDGLDLTSDDLKDGQSEQERQRDLQRQARSTITLGSRQFNVDPDGFAEIAAAVRESMRAGLLRTPFRIDTGPAPPPIGTRRDTTGPRSVYRSADGYNEAQRRVIGLAAEVVALSWLKAQPQYATDAVVTWRSGYKDKVEGGRDGDDLLGYDIEIETKARKFLFEVKGTAEDGAEFELTDREINTARQNTSRDAYRIIFVQHVLDPERTKVHLLPNPFSQRGSDAYRVVGRGLRYRFSAPQ